MADGCDAFEMTTTTDGEKGRSRRMARLFAQLAKVMLARGEPGDARYLEQRALNQLTAST